MEQKNVSPEKKDSILKSLAVAGFVGILLLVAWLSIQLVHLFPAAFSSLASLAEGVNNSQETIVDIDPQLAPITVTANTSLINTGESMTVNWSKVQANGSYVFSYECIDGIAITHKSELGERAIDCATNYNVGNINSLSLTIESEKNRYADVPYTLAFLRTEDTAPRAQGSNVVTVVNTSVDSQFAYVSPEAPETEFPAPEEVVVSETTFNSEDASEDISATSPSAPFKQEYAFTIPVSDPNGNTDLGTSFIGMGEIINGAFVSGPVSVRNPGAIQFVVKNFGTKTSRDWTYTITLPNGDTYESDQQTELKPNERAIITIGFPAGATTPHTFAATVNERTDRNSSNDEFKQVIVFAE